MINTPYRKEYDKDGILLQHNGVTNPHPNRRQRRPRAPRGSKLPLTPGTRLQFIDCWVDLRGKPFKISEVGIPESAQYKIRRITHEVQNNINGFPIYDRMALVAQQHGNVGIGVQMPHYQYAKARRPIPPGARKWPQYGGVVAINENNAIRKHHTIISQYPQK